MLSHRIHPFSFSGTLQLARMPVLRLSGDSEAMPQNVILKPHLNGASTLKALSQELEARGVRTPAGRDR
jgi:hypothetical protein